MHRAGCISVRAFSFSSYEEGFGGEQGNENPALGSRGILNDVDKTALMTTEQGVGPREHWISSSLPIYSPCR